jgi:FKBP-type peptidyl-prolyl cis-trans isomerase 2
VELSNNAMAMVIDVNDQEVKIDANNMLAGKVLTFELEVISIENSVH